MTAIFIIFFKKHILVLHFQQAVAVQRENLNRCGAAQRRFLTSMRERVHGNLRSCCKMMLALKFGVCKRRSIIAVVQEIEHLKKLVDLHGNKFATIAREIGRSRTSVKDKWSDLFLGRSKKSGAWSDSEFKLLEKLVGIIEDLYYAS